MSDKDMHKEFWEMLSYKFKAVGALAQPSILPSTKHWMTFGIDHHKIHLFAVRSVKYETIRLGVQWNGKTVEESNRYFDHLLQYQADIHEKLGFKMEWQRKSDMKRSTIEIEKSSDIRDEVNWIRNKADWLNQIDWMRGKLDPIYKAFKPHTDGLNLDD